MGLQREASSLGAFYLYILLHVLERRGEEEAEQTETILRVGRVCLCVRARYKTIPVYTSVGDMFLYVSILFNASLVVGKPSC